MRWWTQNLINERLGCRKDRTWMADSGKHRKWYAGSLQAKKKQAGLSASAGAGAIGKDGGGQEMWTGQGSAKQMGKSAYERRKMRCQRVKSARESPGAIEGLVSMRRSVEI